MDGVDLLPLVARSPARSSGLARGDGGLAPYVPRPKPLGFDCTGGERAIIDNSWKLVHNPKLGQCDPQPPYSTWTNLSGAYLLFDLDSDYHELHDLSASQPERLARMKRMLDDFQASVAFSQWNETRCKRRRLGER